MNDIVLKLDKNSEKPLYIQLYTYIREEIKTNRIEKGTKLPSIRYLADHLGVSKITVDNAYQQLLLEGYIESRQRSGMYVLEIEESLLPPSNYSKANICNLPTHTDIAYDFKYGAIDIDSFNFNLWRKLTSQTLQSSNGELLQYGDPQGELKLREEIAKYLRTSRGVLCTADQIIITSGTQHSLQLICELTDPNNKSMAIENPGWLRAKLIFQKNDFRITSIPLDKDGICLESLKKSSSKLVYITPSHQFPSGIVMPIIRRQNLLKWAKNTGSFIIEDDYDSEFRYSGRPIPSLQGLDDSESVIYLGSFSKFLAPSLRMSYMVLPKSFLKTYKDDIYKYEQTTSRIDQYILQLFMTNEYWDRHVRRMRIIYSKKHTVLMNAIKKHLHKNIKLIGGNAGLHILLEIINGMDEDTIIQSSKMAGVKIYPASKYWVNHDVLEYPVVLLGFGGLNHDQINNGIELLGHVLNNN
ncbi:PLP-dependent aminotransferase family protein [Wukongibacter baidiensis]|uniref:MocR-like pyridoxine biosynthesis transcription factor PdxR n=1 Tax=Wukongibacter baidiensis TaxID=1723361 RepID=UPI003D7F68E0